MSESPVAVSQAPRPKRGKMNHEGTPYPSKPTEHSIKETSKRISMRKNDVLKAILIRARDKRHKKIVMLPMQMGVGVCSRNYERAISHIYRKTQSKP